MRKEEPSRIIIIIIIMLLVVLYLLIRLAQRNFKIPFLYQRILMHKCRADLENVTI